jgi:MoaA/NifB/PqqE/SkfB family radical SAM enzyme
MGHQEFASTAIIDWIQAVENAPNKVSLSYFDEHLRLYFPEEVSFAKAGAWAALSEQQPGWKIAALTASRLTNDPVQRLHFAKRTFYLSSFDPVSQDNLIVASRRNRGIETPIRPRTNFGKFRCARALNGLDIIAGLDVYSCCPAWLPEKIGNLAESTIDEIWESDLARSIRKSISDSNYDYCNKSLCPFLVTENSDPDPSESDLPFSWARNQTLVHEWHDTSRDDKLKRLHLSYDSSCNLSCPSCRTKTYVAGSSTRKQLNTLFDERILGSLDKVERIWLDGAGDLFASAHCRRLLTLLKEDRYRHIKIDVITNGVLFDEKEWDRFDFDNRLGAVRISIDAGTQETYNVLRRGGDWDRLQSNLRFLSQKRKAGQFDYLRLDTVAQMRNFREIPAIISLGRDLGCDQIGFAIYQSWGTTSEAEFNWDFVFTSDRPEFDEIKSIYDRYRDDPDVQFSAFANWLDLHKDDQPLQSGTTQELR